jgi:uroporphyrinogen-III synthase
MVLITRPQPQADETARRIAAMGLVPLVAPMLEVAAVAVPWPPPETIQAILITSSNALLAELCALGPDIPLLAVGDATAARAHRAGHRRVYSAAGDAAALKNLATQLCAIDGGTLLLASGHGQGHGLAAVLRQHGFAVAHHEVYRAAPVAEIPADTRAALQSGAVQAALFFSAETARVFVELAVSAGLRDATAHVDALAISPSTASALAPLPWRRFRVAVQPNQNDLMALLQ